MVFARICNNLSESDRNREAGIANLVHISNFGWGVSHHGFHTLTWVPYFTRLNPYQSALTVLIHDEILEKHHSPSSPRGW